jgi:hypothetical protein
MLRHKFRKDNDFDVFIGNVKWVILISFPYFKRKNRPPWFELYLVEIRVVLIEKMFMDIKMILNVFLSFQIAWIVPN